MNAIRVKHCLLAIASINHALMAASAGNECLDSMADSITELLLIGGNELEAEARRYPVRVIVLDDYDTQQDIPPESDRRATS